MDVGNGEFDHVIVGAGSAGCVIARRLVDAGRRVALIEAGGWDTNPAIHDPLRAWELWNSSEDWAYLTEPQEHSAKARLAWPRGKVVGGSSCLNGMIYVRGAREDFDNWAYNGAVGWSYEDVLPFFRKSEDFEDGPSAFHGAGGPLPVARNHDPNPATMAFLDACAGYGIPLNDDPNGESIFGAGLCHLTVRDGRRASAWVSFIVPVLDSPLLTVITGAQASSLIFGSAGRAVGVRLTGVPAAIRAGGDVSISAGRSAGGVSITAGRSVSVRPSADGPAEVRCAGDVIISSGVIGSPQLLLLSGIGPADELSLLGIDVRADLPGVGENLHDHALATVLYEAAREIPPGTAQNLEAHFFAASDPAMVAPDLQPLMSHFPMPVEGYPVPDYGWGYAIVAGIIRPMSRGRLWLRSADPGQPPALDPHYLEDPADVAALLASLEISREIGAEAGLRDWRVREIAPGPGIRAKADLLDYGMRNLITYHHQVGTCKMGIDRLAVVAPDLRVHGVEGLRVADASVMPAVTSGNTNAPTIMIGERCADFLLNS